MGRQGVTDNGKRAFGEFLAQTRQSPEVRTAIAGWLQETNAVEPLSNPISQEQFARWVTATSRIPVTESAIGRIERGEGRGGPPLDVLIALCERMDILKLSDGSTVNLSIAAAILTGELDPAQCMVNHDG